MHAFSTGYEAVMAALRGQNGDNVPFTVYECFLYQCALERELRNRGLCVVYRTRSYQTRYPNVKKVSRCYEDERGRQLTQTVYSTPLGDLSCLTEPAENTTWTHEYLFKTPDDYKALLFLINDTVLTPDYNAAARKAARLGPDFAVRDQIPYEPLQQLISGYMGTETYCYEWMDNRDEIMRLYDALVEVNRKIYRIVAEGPLEFANYGGNVTPSIIGAETFRKYYIPNYNEACETLHKKGKLIGTHLDADNTLIMEDVAATGLDYIEAYDAGISPPVNAARKAWPDKVLWLNWPSSWHLNTPETVRAKTRELIRDAGTRDGLIIGITEDVPEERLQCNFKAIMDGIDDISASFLARK